MRNKLVTVALLLILIGILSLLGIFVFKKPNAQGLINPAGRTIIQQITNQKITPTLIQTPTPIKFNFNESTDLESELDSINPEVLDSDFENLKTTVTNL